MDWREACRVEVRSVGSLELPAVSLGTSPFIGAGQFGARAMEYRRRLYEHPEAAVALMATVAEMGITGVQLLLYRPLIDAFKEARRRTGISLVALPTVGPRDIDADLEAAVEVEAPVAIVHGAITDQCRSEALALCARAIRARGMVPGFATHAPLTTIPFVEREELDCAFYMAPVNALGYLMGDSRVAIELYEKLDRPILAKKPLAAGRLAPSQAFPFLADRKNVPWIAVGVASEEEAHETFSKAIEVWGREG